MDKDYLMRYLNTKGDDIAWDFIRCGYSSVSRTCITLIQASSNTSSAQWCFQDAGNGTADA